MTEEIIERLHELEEKRRKLKFRVEEFDRIFNTRPKELIVKIFAYGWNPLNEEITFRQVPPEIIDALEKMQERTVKELEDINRQIKEL